MCFIPEICSSSRNSSFPREGDRVPFMYSEGSSTGPCKTNPVTLPVDGSHSTPSQSWQQSAPTHDSRVPVVSFRIMDLNPRREALSDSAQAGV
ncbi:hypothetical protein MLD38_011286 [Melastoma candidum]|uniref:Uncharacterized protein n=1 Tax=Melastoma candidum TaxID=119954 RepID=A0ACB9R3X1_9MYRT|nr:hypothetical protein MLD38_011286 [Melastoma candidum]